MSNEQPSRPRRSGSSASPMGSTLAIVIAIAAVVVGFLILKNIRSDDDGGTTATTVATTLPIDSSTTTPTTLPVGPTTTVFTPTTTGALIVVANSSRVDGAAGQLTTALKGKGYTMGTATNGSPKQEVTKVQYKDGDTAAQAVADTLARQLGVAQIEVIPATPELSDPTTLGDATVLVLLGNDKAGKTLDQMSGAAPDTSGSTSSTAAP